MARLPRPKKRLGQNFLVQPAVARRIVEQLPLAPGDSVVELGPGAGALTRELLLRGARILAVELDSEAVSLLEKEFQGCERLEILHGDMLELDYARLRAEMGCQLRIVGNLPYNISTQLLIRLIRCHSSISWAALMFQKEVAQRICAHPGTKQYGTLSVMAQYCANIKRLIDVSPGSFLPKPKVYSSVIFMRFKSPAIQADDFDFFASLVRTSFQQRRKKIVNALRNFRQFTTEEIQYALSQSHIDTTYRAEQVPVESFVILSNILTKIRAIY